MEESTDNRLQLEWLVVNALRENLAMIDDNTNVTYNRAIEFAQNNFRELFGKDDSVLGKKEFVDSLYEKYTEEAEARTISGNKKVTPESLIQARITEIEKLLDALSKSEKSRRRLMAEKEKLSGLLKEAIPTYLRVSEDEALRNDYEFINRVNLTHVRQVAGKYRIFKTKSNDPFVIRFLHPGTPEAATGADLIYEQHNGKGQVRIIAVQYKIWEDGTLYFSGAKNLNKQLETSKSCFCDKGFCDNAKDSLEVLYRFPCCIPFLRPTDKLLNPDAYFSSGWHLPICELSKRTELSYKGHKMLKMEKIKDIALNAPEFERLFSKGIIGSRWFPAEELIDFYKRNKVLEPNEDRILIFSQKF
jgi:hypothetical protein